MEGGFALEPVGKNFRDETFSFRGWWVKYLAFKFLVMVALHHFFGGLPLELGFGGLPV